MDPFAPAAIAYTSGTTGHPKGSVHSQRNLVMVGAANAHFGIWRRDPRQGAVLALTILNVMALCPLLAFQLGGTCVCIDRSDPIGLADWIEREQVASLSTGVGGTSCPETLRSTYRRRLGGAVCASYGLTEAPAAVSTQSPDVESPPGSSGRPIPHLDVTVRDPAGRELGTGEVGEICVGAPDVGAWADVYTPFLGYWNQPSATAEALRGGVLHTGDLGHLDEGGELFVHARMNDLIVRGGSNVYPAEVERVLLEDPRVAAAAAVGMPDSRLGERVVAFVELVAD
ncbi:MAG: class I adenylate-forming enzyme family protein, partial [Acidimicrobiales bacterium]